MDTSYLNLKNEILKAKDSVSKLLAKISSEQTHEWEKTCKDIVKQISEDKMKIAIVGAIKSGKSTFINSIFGKDYLKRGAGVITSIITKIGFSDNLKANLYFKFIENINKEIKNALILFPLQNSQNSQDSQSLDNKDFISNFNIKNNEDRQKLSQALNNLETNSLITSEASNYNYFLLLSYLKGFDRVLEFFDSEGLMISYEQEEFYKYIDFSSDDSLAIYLKDIRIDLPINNLFNNIFDSSIEIADCQGSDSINPIHISMIQNYLIYSHFIIYVISSRTGLREADIKFLSIIKKMQMLDSIVFIINIDFSEHESIQDLNRVIAKTKQDIGLLKRDAEIFSISSLFNLFKNYKDNNIKLLQKDDLRFAQWSQEQELINLSNTEYKNFQEYLFHKLTKDRYFLLLKNHIERLDIILSGINNWIFMNREILSKDSSEKLKITQKAMLYKDRLNKVDLMIKSIIEGSLKDIKNKMAKNIEFFFDIKYGEIALKINDFIANYNIDFDKYAQNKDGRDFANSLYLVFQEFRQALDTFMVENINPNIAGFIKTQEKQILEHFEIAKVPFDTAVRDIIFEFYKSIGVSKQDNSNQDNNSEINLEPIKQKLELNLFNMIIPLYYSNQVKLESTLRFGFYKIFAFIREALKKRSKKNQLNNNLQSQDRSENSKILALISGFEGLKQEVQKNFGFHFKDYKENIKYQYVFKLIDATSQYIQEFMIDKFKAYSSGLLTILDTIDKKESDKQKARESLAIMESECLNIRDKLNNLKNFQIN